MHEGVARGFGGSYEGSGGLMVHEGVAQGIAGVARGYGGFA